MSRISHFSRILLLLTLALLPRLAQAQRIGPLGPTDRQQSKALSTERTAAPRPPSLQLSLPSPAAVALPPLGPDDLQRLQPQEGRPPLIGVHRRLPAGAVTRSFSGGAVKTTAEGAWQSTAVGRLWRLKMTSPSARAMRIHFRDFAIGAGSLWLYSASGQVVGPYTGSGLYGDGDFWSGIVFGDSLTIEYMPDGASTKEAVPFQIVAISHIWDDAFGGGVEGGVRWPQGALGSSDRRGSLKPLPDRINVAVGTQLKKSRLTKAIQLVERSASLQQPRPKAARPLTPGRPVSFSRGPVDSPTLFHGDFSYQLEVPEDATRVTFTLESDADVQLLVRYGEDNDLENGRPVFDYSADEFFAGTEEIVITPQSDPPLQAGTYFVSVGVLATGVEVNCTLTAEVEREGGTPPPTSDGTLTPSQPVSFQRGPVDNPTIFFGNHSFRLEVPEDASRVTFTLESDADVELAVRYGEDNAVEDRLVTDHRSRNPAGNERILITPRSDPPLRSGTYFVSVIVWATGVIANCTLTAEVELGEEDQTPISGGTLTPGQPADFRLGPVDSRTLFTGDHSFRLEAPENASRITFTLESVDPDVDVDLYVRFGEDNMIQNGRPVFDHRSQKLTGSERIGITRRSDPPLRAGTYFVSVLVFDTGVVAEGTLTATVETDAADCHLDATCYPEWSSSASGVALIAFETSEGSYACSGTLLNNRRQDLTPYFLTAAHCVDTEEEARSVTAFWLYQTQTCNGDLPDLRSVPQTEGAGLISTFGGADRHDGDMTLLQLEGDLPDAIVFQGWDADPQPVGAQVTGIHHPRSDDWGFFKRIAFGQIIPESVFGTTDDTYFNVSYPVGQGYTERGSSGSAIFSNSETVVGALSGGDIVGYACPTEPVVDVFTHFSVFYPHIRPFIDSTLPEISGGALPPGQPAAFRLGPVDAPMLFSGDSSFQVEVPEGATRVTFTLESIDPDVNVDLYVRYGEDNAIQDGNVVSDYSSEGSTGNEQIVVTRQSDPPLRAGTYFVSLMLRTTGAVAEVTVTAEFDAPPPTGGQIYYFPHLAVGASWQTTITYINYSAEEVSCRTDFLSDQGTPLMVSFADKGTVPSRTDVLLPGGSVHQETNVELNTPFAPGWARATCSGPVKASLLFRLHNSEGVPIAEGGVNAAAVPATLFVTFAEQGEGKQGTGVAYANPSATEAVVTFTARDADGQMLASVDKNLSPNGHAAQNMAPLFTLSSFTGSLRSHLHGAHRQSVDQCRSCSRILLLASGRTGCCRAGIDYLLLSTSCRGTEMANHDHLYQLLLAGGEMPNRFHLRSRKSADGFVCGTGNGCQPNRRSVARGIRSPGDQRGAECAGSARLGAGHLLRAGEGQPSVSSAQQRRGAHSRRRSQCGGSSGNPVRHLCRTGRRQAGDRSGLCQSLPPQRPSSPSRPKTRWGRRWLASIRHLLSNEHAAQNMAPLFALSSFTGSLEVTSTVPIVSLSINAEAAPVFSSLPPGELDAATPAPPPEPSPTRPTNDMFSNAQTISGPSGRVTGSNVGATDETGEPEFRSSSSSVWWQWRAPSSGRVTIDTIGSSFDTTLGVYTGTRVDTLTTLGENDDAVEFGGASRVTLTVTAGTVYRLRVAGFFGDEGSIVLNWNPTTSPTNDMFSNAQTISGPSGRVTGSNVGATDETGEPGFGSSSVWWQWRAPSSGRVTIDTIGSSFDTTLGVYTGTRVDTLTTLGENDDAVEFGGASRVTLTVTAETVYRLRVAGFFGDEGSIVLNWNPTTSPTNDMFSNARTISGPSGRVTGSNVGATDETGEPGFGSSSVWWQWRAPSSGRVTIDTIGSSFDTTLGVYTGTRVDTLTTLGENDDTVEFGGASRVTLTVTAGTVYRLRVAGFFGAEGSIVLNWNLQTGL